MELDVTWNRVIRVWWAYFWRNLVAILASVVAGAILGFAVGIICGIVGIEPGAIKIFAGILGGLVGIAFSVVPMKMILGKNFGEFRLVLLSRAAVQSLQAK